MTKAERREALGRPVHVPPGFNPYHSFKNEEMARIGCVIAETWDRHKRRWHPEHISAYSGTDCSGYFVIDVKEHWVIRADRFAGWDDWHPFILLGISAICWSAIILWAILRR